MATKAIAALCLLLVQLFGPHSITCAAQSTHEQAELLKAPIELNISEVKLTIEPGVYLDLMPGITASPGHKVDCTKEGRLIVTVRINVSVLPKDTTIENVWLHSDGKWWSGRFNTNETRLRNGKLRMITRACPAQTFQPGVLVDVIVEVRSKRTIQYLRAPSKQLEGVH